MSKLEELIQQFCPDGVEYVKLGDIEAQGLIKLGRGNVISKEDMRACPGDYPVYSSSSVGDGEIGRYGKYMFDDERISWSIDGGGKFFYRNNLKYSITNVSGWLKVLDTNKINTKYLFFTLMNEWVKKVYDYTHKAHPSVIREEYELPVPPLPVQEEIVRILDTFTELQAELQAELQKRLQQYNYYRDYLFTTFSPEKEVKECSLGEIGTFTRGNGLQKKDFTETGVGCIHYGQIYTRFGAFTDKTLTYVDEELASHLLQVEKGNLVIACTSENVEDICKCVAWLGDENICTGGHACVFRHQQNPKYISYFFQTEYFFNQKVKYTYGTKVKDIKPDSIAKIRIPLPSLEEQDRIVSILDNLYTLTNDLSQGLPAEIEKRKQQYEFYRDKLLTFKRIGND